VNFARLKLPLLLRFGILFLLLAGIAFGQQAAPFVVEPPPNAAYPDYGPEGNILARKLRHQPTKKFTFDRAALRDVLRYLAEDAQIPFICVPDGAGAGDGGNKGDSSGLEKALPRVGGRLVTFTMESSPFVALEGICRDNGIQLTFNNGIWNMTSTEEVLAKALLKKRDLEDSELIGKVYVLRNDPGDRIDFQDRQTNAQDQGGQTGSSWNSATAIPLQYSQRVFRTKEPRIVNEIRQMLGLPIISYNPDGTIKDSNKPDLNAGPSYKAASLEDQGKKSSSSQQVIYNSDNNTLWVVATKEQHKWVAEYLMAVDNPQNLIAIEVKFFETSKDPSKAYGINWANTFGGQGLTFRGSAQASGTGGVTVTTQNGNTANNAFNTASQVGTGPQTFSDNGTLQPGQPPYSYSLGQQNKTDFSDKSYNATFNAPYSAVLSMDQVAVSIKAFMQDTGTTVVQYPRVLTVNNREVAISSSIMTPILASSTSVGQGGTSTSSQNIGWFPIGTQINILPKTIGIKEIAMNVAITISTYVADKSISGNLYPVTASRIYNAALQVSQGYTLAVGGLETTDDHASSDGIPVMRDIPIVGQFFKSKGRSRNKKNLIIFITPTIIENPKATRGISETPESVIPIRPNDPTPPAFTPDGQLVGGRDAIPAAFAWLDFQIKWFKQVNKENRTDRESIKQLRAVISSARMLVRDIGRMQENADPVLAQEMSSHQQRAIATLTELNRTLSVAQNNLM
jgi:Flp pilus assembly secretin CpaC